MDRSVLFFIGLEFFHLIMHLKCRPQNTNNLFYSRLNLKSYDRLYGM